LNIQSGIKELMNWGNPSALLEAGLFFQARTTLANAATAAKKEVAKLVNGDGALVNVSAS
jgi:hypothetical protein